MGKRTKKSRWARAANKAPSWIRSGVIGRWSVRAQRQHDGKKLGTFGAASTVRLVTKNGVEVDDGELDAQLEQATSEAAPRYDDAAASKYRSIGGRKGQRFQMFVKK